MKPKKRKLEMNSRTSLKTPVFLFIIINKGILDIKNIINLIAVLEISDIKGYGNLKRTNCIR